MCLRGGTGGEQTFPVHVRAFAFPVGTEGRNRCVRAECDAMPGSVEADHSSRAMPRFQPSLPHKLSLGRALAPEARADPEAAPEPGFDASESARRGDQANLLRGSSPSQVVQALSSSVSGNSALLS